MMRFVVDGDSAFLWETEALRSAPPRRPIPAPRRVQTVDRGDEDWITLRRAYELTGIPVPTLRKWARNDNVDSYLEETAVGQLRMVSLRDIYHRAEDLGRELKTQPILETPTEVDEPVPTELDLTSDEPVATYEGGERQVPEGTMLVPLDAWNKMLNQLGNLHEAGQQLAEARERAARAETEATFLRERLAEMRTEMAETRLSPTSSEPAETDTEDVPTQVSVEDDDGSSEGPQGASPREADESSTHIREQRSFTEYSLEMVKHLLSTWRRRPRR